MTHEQNVRRCLNYLLPPSWHPCPLEHPLPSSNFHRRVHRGKTQRQTEHVGSFRCIWQSDVKKDIDKNLTIRETETLTETVKFINLALVSNPLAVAPNFKSARNSGKLRKQSARRASSPSLSSFLSSAWWSGPRRDSRSFQCGWSDSKPSYADKAMKLYLCNVFLIRVRSCVKTELNNFRIGANRVAYADARTWGFDKGLSSFRSLYSSCYNKWWDSDKRDDLTITYFRSTHNYLGPFCKFPPCRQRFDHFCLSHKPLSLAFQTFDAPSPSHICIPFLSFSQCW